MKRTRQGFRPRVSRLFSTLAAGPSLLVMAGALAVATPAAAQVETVTVTAQYTQQNIQNTPLAITAVTSQDLEERGITDLSQLGTSVPGLSLTKAPAAFGNGVQTYIRGIGQYDTAFASEPGVGIYIDDVYYGTMSGEEMDLLDLNRVEILKGPQGVLGGKNDIGGAIRLVTQKPQGDDSGYLEATYGSYDELNLKGAVDVAIVPDHLFMRLSATSEHQDGYINEVDYTCKWGAGTNASGPGSAGSMPASTTRADCIDGQQGGTDVQGARLAFRAIVNDHLEDNLSVEVIRDNSELTPDVMYAVDAGTAADPSGATGNVYYNNGHGLQSVPRAQFLGTNSLGEPVADSGIPLWNSSPALTVPIVTKGGPLAQYGIPWDQRFIPTNPFKYTYGNYISQNGLAYNQGEMMHSWDAVNLLDWDITDNIHVKSITGYRYYNGAYSNDSDASPMSFQLTTTYPSNREFQQEVRFTGSSLDDRLDWTAGVFYYNRTNRSHGPVILDADWDEGDSFLVFEQNDTYKTTNKSAYIHLIYHILDNLEIFGGVRYTKESKTYYFDHSGAVPGYAGSGFFRDTVDPTLSCNIFAGLTCDHTISPALVPNTSKTSRPDWRGGIDYHFTDDIMTYFQYSTGYRTGGTNSRPFAPDQLNSYGPEEIASYEVGLKSDWFEHRLRLNVAAYDANYTNTIVPLAETDYSLGFPLPEVLYVNLGSSKDKGFELEATAAPIDNLLLTANYSYVDYSANPVPGAVQCPTDGPAVCGPGVTGNYLDGCSPAAVTAGICPQAAAGTVRVGTNPILFPKQQLSLSGQYTFIMGDGMGSLTPRLDYSWVSTVYQDANNNNYTAIPAHGLLDGRLTWDAPAGGWQLSLAGSNLTNKKYFLDMTDFAIFGEGTVEAQPAPGREWMLTLRKNF